MFFFITFAGEWPLQIISKQRDADRLSGQYYDYPAGDSNKYVASQKTEQKSNAHGLAVPNGAFRTLKRPVLHSKTPRFASQNVRTL